MKVTIVQTALFWEDREKNLAHFDQLLASLAEDTDLVVLPEMFTTGFSMSPEVMAEPSEGRALEWMRRKAQEKKCIVTGSVSVEENGLYYNRLFWVRPNGSFEIYDKRHLFKMGNEDQHYSQGKKKIVTRINDWKIMPLICYDLRFPVWSRNTFKRTSATSCEAGYDVLIYVANWPEVRSYAWRQLLVARAIENQCYVIGVNRIGVDGNGYNHSGDSVVLNPRGEVISQSQPGQESIETVTLDRNYLETFRKIFPVGLDADPFTLNL